MRSALVLFVGALITVQADEGRVLADRRRAFGGDAAIPPTLDAKTFDPSR
jgi:hypothetical protein